MKIRTGEAWDNWRGNNRYVSFQFKKGGHLLFALRKQWHWYFVKPHGKPGYKRMYLGPLEIEWFRARRKV